MKLYSKDAQAKLIGSMIRRDRLCHSFLLTGEKGIGKKTFAKYMAKAILCEKGLGEPCDECRSCRMVEHGAHPDVIYVIPSGKSENFRVDDLRPVISDASIAANEGGYKIYIIAGIDKALPAAQNTLLKIFEEPPEHVVFIMTAQQKERVLPTIVSRAQVIGLPFASGQDVLDALTSSGIPAGSAQEAYKACGGNIGRCLEYALRDGGVEAQTIEQVKKIAGFLASGDEYSLACTLYQTDRDLCLSMCLGLSELICDAGVIKQGGTPSSSYRSEAVSLAGVIRLDCLMNMFDDIGKAIDKLTGNANIVLTMCDLCSRLKADSV